MTEPLFVPECASATEPVRHSTYAVAVAWLLPLTTSLITAVALIAGVLLTALGIVLRRYEGCAIGVVLLCVGGLTATRAIRELREAVVIHRQHQGELSPN